MAINENLLLSIPNTARAIRVPESTLRGWIDAGRIPTHSRDDGRSILLRVGDALNAKANPPRRGRRTKVASIDIITYEPGTDGRDTAGTITTLDRPESLTVLELMIRRTQAALARMATDTAAPTIRDSLGNPVGPFHDLPGITQRRILIKHGNGETTEQHTLARVPHACGTDVRHAGQTPGKPQMLDKPV